MSPISSNSLITVTGISGFIGFYIALAALQAGHRVRGTLRSPDRANSIKDAYIKLGIENIDSRLEFQILDDLSSVEKYSKVFKGSDAIIHPAVDVTKYTEPVFVDHAVQSTLSMLRAAQQAGASLKRIVLTSTMASAVPQGAYRDKMITAEDWNEDSKKAMDEAIAANKTPSPQDIYTVGKVQSEKAAWEFMEKEKPSFDLVSILPAFCIGPVQHGKPQSTSLWIANLFKGDTSVFTSLDVPLNWHIDVRDCGKAHVAALTDPSLGGKRFICANRPAGLDEVLAILRKNFPNVKTIAPDVSGHVGAPWTQPLDNQVGKRLLGQFISVEQSLVDVGRSLGY